MGVLRTAWAAWRRIAHAIGTFQSRLVLTLLYFVLLGPFALCMRLLSDPLRMRRRAGSSHWLARAIGPTSLRELRRQ